MLGSWKDDGISSKTNYGWRTLNGKPNEGSISPYIDNAKMSCRGTSNIVSTLYFKGYAYCGRYDKNLYVHNQTTCAGLWDYTEVGNTVYLWLSNNPPPWI